MKKFEKKNSSPLWTPTIDRIENSNLTKYIKFVNSGFSKNFRNYQDIYAWSIENLEQFWESIWQYTEIKFSKPYSSVISGKDKMPGSIWFPDSKLNFAENLLRYRDENIAILFRGETGITRKISYKSLFESVGRLSDSLRKSGVGPGDRVAGFMPNIPEAIIAMLATTSIGAIWSSSSPDFGTQGVLDRFGQIGPKVLFAAEGYFFKGKRVDCIGKISEIASKIPTLEKVIIVPYTLEKAEISTIEKAVHFNDFLTSHITEPVFEQLPFSHPVYIMYSSGTTGLPKCMVQGTGVLINHLKELILHTDLKRNDRIFYFTTCGWMMWNWLVSSLSVGATIVLFDGNPFYPGPEALWKIADEEGISIFGTSARYITSLESSGIKPGKMFELKNLRTILSTGSPLSHENFEFVYKEIKSDIQLSSISGGTDLNGCFALGNPILPVYPGELQCRGLGMKVEVFDANGKTVIGEKGELICSSPFPSMPLYFFSDQDGKKYHDAYFNKYPGIWRHGDFAEITESGGMIIYGRSDATLNPGGVRIGTADIYRQIEGMEGIEDTVVIGQEWEKDERVILFVKMKPGYTLSDKIKADISQKIKTNVSPRHVPAKIIGTPDIPYTLNMKKVEIAVKKAVQNEPITNKEALLNPECLEYFMNIPELKTN